MFGQLRSTTVSILHFLLENAADSMGIVKKNKFEITL